jgi:hypothetical protein
VYRSLTLCAAAVLLASGCRGGVVSNDDRVSERAAKQSVERFLTAIHAGHETAACAQLPLSQQRSLARLSASRRGSATCPGALRTLREFALARSAGPLSFSHQVGFRGALPHKSRLAVDRVSIDGRTFGAIGLRRQGDQWAVALVCQC